MRKHKVVTTTEHFTWSPTKEAWIPVTKTVQTEESHPYLAPPPDYQWGGRITPGPAVTYNTANIADMDQN